MKLKLNQLQTVLVLLTNAESAIADARRVAAAGGDPKTARRLNALRDRIDREVMINSADYETQSLRQKLVTDLDALPPGWRWQMLDLIIEVRGNGTRNAVALPDDIEASAQPYGNGIAWDILDTAKNIRLAGGTVPRELNPASSSNRKDSGHGMDRKS